MRLSFINRCIVYNLVLFAIIYCIDKFIRINARARFLKETWQNAQVVYTNVLDLR